MKNPTHMQSDEKYQIFFEYLQKAMTFKLSRGFMFLFTYYKFKLMTCVVLKPNEFKASEMRVRVKIEKIYLSNLLTNIFCCYHFSSTILTLLYLYSQNK